MHGPSCEMKEVAQKRADGGDGSDHEAELQF